MINANELRIGNFIEANGPTMEVKAIYDDHVELYLHGSESDNWDEDLEACNGIPLTPAILEKCGFEKMPLSSVKRWAIYHPTFYLQLGARKEWYVYGYRFYPNQITYLHQLQNLYFALTNTELNYKP